MLCEFRQYVSRPDATTVRHPTTMPPALKYKDCDEADFKERPAAESASQHRPAPRGTSREVLTSLMKKPSRFQKCTFQFYKHGAVHYLVMEFMPCDLRTLLREQDPLLGVAHKKRIVFQVSVRKSEPPA